MSANAVSGIWWEVTPAVFDDQEDWSGQARRWALLAGQTQRRFSFCKKVKMNLGRKSLFSEL
jgi:hypothetical protein